MVCLDFLKRNLRKLLLTRVYNSRLLKPSLCLLSDVHYHAADVLFWVFLRTADATRSQLSSECCVVDVYRFCEAYWWSLAVWHDRDGEHWCRVICVAICWINWRLFAVWTGAFEYFSGCKLAQVVKWIIACDTPKSTCLQSCRQLFVTTPVWRIDCKHGWLVSDCNYVCV